MAQIHVDPHKLRDFAGKLGHFAEIVDDHINGLDSYLRRLGDTWSDQEFESFKQEFYSAQQQLKLFVEETKKTIPNLERDASHIEEYQRVKLR